MTIKEIFDVCVKYILENYILFSVIAGLFILALVFLILYTKQCKKTKLYKQSHDKLPDIEKRLDVITSKIEGLYKENESLTYEKRELLDENVKLRNFKNEHDKDQDLKDELERMKQKNAQLESKFANKMTTTTRTSELTMGELSSLPKTELEKICKKRKLTGWTSLKKAELVEFIYNKIHK